MTAPSELVLEGLLIRAAAGRVRVILDPYYLDFDADDVVDIEELPTPVGLLESHAIAARVTLAAGARMLAIGPVAAYREYLWPSRRPFALLTPASVDHPTTFDVAYEREQTFLRARGLVGDVS